MPMCIMYIRTFGVAFNSPATTVPFTESKHSRVASNVLFTGKQQMRIGVDCIAICKGHCNFDDPLLIELTQSAIAK
jgi:hypothetical protein